MLSCLQTPVCLRILLTHSIKNSASRPYFQIAWFSLRPERAFSTTSDTPYSVVHLISNTVLHHSQPKHKKQQQQQNSLWGKNFKNSYFLRTESLGTNKLLEIVVIITTTWRIVMYSHWSKSFLHNAL